jgi:hypothetical protein
MCSMVVTLDVSKLSGWLNSYAFCQVEGRAYDVVEVCGRREGVEHAVAAKWHARGRPRKGPGCLGAKESADYQVEGGGERKEARCGRGGGRV